MTPLQKVAASILCALFALIVLVTFLLPAHYAGQFRDIPNAGPSSAPCVRRLFLSGVVAPGPDGFGSRHLRCRARRPSLRLLAPGALLWLQTRAPLGAPCCAKSSAALLCAIFHFDPTIHFDRSE